MKRLLLTAATLFLATSQMQAADLAFRQQAFQLPAEAEQLLVADTNGDGLKDLITVIDKTIRIYFHGDSGFNFDTGFDEIALDADAVGWDLSEGYSSSGGASIITLVNGREVLAWHVDGDSIQEPETVSSNLPGFISRGINRLHFSRDINADGFEDLIIPGAGVLNIYINDAGQSYQSALSIQSEVRLRTALNINRFNRSAGQSIRIPVLNLRDINSDGYDDLVSRTDERLDVFIAAIDGDQYFPTLPSYSLDIAAIEERLGDFDIDNLDFSNLTGVLALTHEEILDDVDGDGIEDLLLREGGKVSLFTGTGEGMDFSQPRQVLRSGGNVLSTFLFDENEDGLKDLWLWRVEPISVGDIFVWLALSGSIAIEAFIYPNDGERFARRPSRKVSVDLRFPSVLRLANAYEDLSNEAEELEGSDFPPTSVGNLDAELSQRDLLVLVNNEISVFLNSIEPDSESEEFLGSLGYSRQRDDYEINIREIIDNVSLSGSPELASVQDRQPDQVIELSEAVGSGDIIAAALNNDGRDDIFVFTAFDGSHIEGILLLSN